MKRHKFDTLGRSTYIFLRRGNSLLNKRMVVLGLVFDMDVFFSTLRQNAEIFGNEVTLQRWPIFAAAPWDFDNETSRETT